MTKGRNLINNQNDRRNKYLVVLVVVGTLVLSSMACSLPITIGGGNDGGGQPQYEEPFNPEEQPFEPEWEEPFPPEEEPFHEEWEEPFPPEEEPFHEEWEEPFSPGEEPFPPGEEPPPFEEPMPEPPPAAPQPQPQNPSPQPSGSQGGAWSADAAITDIYPGNQPHGQFHARITNHGPGTMDKVQVRVVCSSERTDKNNGSLSSGGMADLNLTVSLKPGETYSVPTGLTLDTNTFEYLVGCQMHDTYPDPDLGNNTYSEQFK